MFDLDQFLSEFENLIFDEHLIELRSFKRRHGNAVSCSCSHINAEKEYITKIMDKYSKLSKRVSNREPESIPKNISYDVKTREEKIRSGSYDVVG